jgi:hypothetical protein
MVASPRIRPTVGVLVADVRRQANAVRASAPSAAPSTIAFSAHADGSEQKPLVFTDEAGTPRIGLVDPTIPSSPSNQQLFLADTSGRLMVTTDLAGGLATPWLSVPLYPQFVSTNTGFPAAGGDAFTLSPAVASRKTLVWAGYAPTITHAAIQLQGLFGFSGTCTWSMEVGGTQVGTWSTTGVTAGPGAPWSCASQLGLNGVTVNVYLLTWSAMSAITCQVYGAFLRGST